MDEDLLEEWCAFISDQSFDLDNPISEQRPSADCVKIENQHDTDSDDDVDSMIPRSIAERRAEKFGVFDVSRISTTARFRTSKTNPSLVSPDGCSPCIVIPPGISAAELLDSPIMLSNSQISPTTGTFLSPPYNGNRSMINPASPTKNRHMVGIDGFSSRLMLHENPSQRPGFPGSENQVSSPSEHAQSLGADDDYQTLDLEPLTFNFDNPSGFMTEAPNVQSADSHSDAKLSQISQSHKQLIPKNENIAERDQRGTYPSMGTLRTSDDGYNWRKYGQKQVKGSEYPRSYYKCTNSNCLVKKKVERSHDGQITEIIYKGSHTHPQSQPTRRTMFSCNDMPAIGENSESFVTVEGRSQRTSPTSVVMTGLPDSLSTRQGKSKREFQSDENPELSYTFATGDDDEDELSHELMGVDDDESELKRRKKDNNCLIETSMASRSAREPRVVVSVESEVDILEDGYRWRKYGQKVVKGNPNPRSYYKCTSAGCLVRKHVERSSDDLKCVITAYEGKHDHEVPAARNSNHMNSHPGNLPPSSQSPLALPRPTTNMPKTERQVEDTAPLFEMKPEFNNQFLRPPFLGNDHQFGPTSFYQMKFPPLHNPMPYCSSFGMNPNIGIHQNRLSAPGLPHLPISVPLNVPRPGNLNFINHGKYISPVPSFHQPSENDVRLVRPKQEQNDDNPYDAQLPSVDCASGSSSSSTSTYRQMMGSFLY